MPVDSGRFRFKACLGMVQFAIMLQTMYAKFATRLFNRPNHFFRNLVVFAGHKIEGGSKPEPPFQRYEAIDASQAFRPLDIMRENKAELLAPRPPRPIWRSISTLGVDRPGTRFRPTLPIRPQPAQAYPETPR